MSPLQIIDVFDSYYEGRKAPFVSDESKPVLMAEKRDGEKRVSAPKAEAPLSRAA